MKSVWVLLGIIAALAFVPFVWLFMGWAVIGLTEVLFQENWVDGFWNWRNLAAGVLLAFIGGLFSSGRE